ncbi:flavodoxin domain-containing protein [Rhodococcus sp. BP-252]|uniref:Nitric oxide synthase n=1 Tax=Rhodococcoides kyotonense TaxID=398843 RepID=A0A177Y954_9NOCA|nr:MULTISPECIES: flavodoxin domain-containing protein [Rhodococcus]MBY6412489.1 flavodoxin domain-containing protein [Rhodococcus sp. BP-320]MBY6417069.1 flavodoxin domain-containing protein [Rhodococcus sp. BP-321]MBY6424067.1 flavodoxin domain-containing protein [Rhodococcus sp. BP-324]MBY6427093.1 flavodoxin domain-containing protein [Rhodococcus sp. BP-323]MBY6432422.1 flavodoxin domain-containing protein [Rhodococcus sp. BP-322]
MAVVVLFGSETGTAEEVADKIAEVLSDHDAEVRDMLEYEVSDIDVNDFHVIICSTYGDGELPTGAVPFYEALDEDAPDLKGLRFALFGLGDRVYEDTFNRGGEIIAEKLVELGAEQVHEHARHDSSSNVKPKAQAEEWARELSGLLVG